MQRKYKICIFYIQCWQEGKRSFYWITSKTWLPLDPTASRSGWTSVVLCRHFRMKFEGNLYFSQFDLHNDEMNQCTCSLWKREVHARVPYKRGTVLYTQAVCICLNIFWLNTKISMHFCYVGDGDSSGNTVVGKAKPYSPTVFITKEECVSHMSLCWSVLFWRKL